MTTTRESREVLTVPNLITAIRLFLLTPLFPLALLGWNAPGLALVVAIVLGCSDWVDGAIARRFHQVTELGRLLDPVADRLSQLTVCVSLVVATLLPAWMAIVLIAADLVLGITLLVRRSGPIPVRWIGRIRTALLMVGLPLLLLVATVAPDNAPLRVIALTIVGAGTILHAFANGIYTWTLIIGTADQQRDAHPASR